MTQKKWKLMAGLTAIVMMLSGCGGGASSSAAQPASTPSPAASQAPSSKDAAPSQESATPSASQAAAPAAQEGISVDGVHSYTETKPFKIGYVVMNYTNPIYSQVAEFYQYYCDKYGVEIIMKNCETTLEKQVEIFENFIEMGVDVIICDAIDADALVDVAQQAAEKGIVVIGATSEFQTKDKTYYLNSDYGLAYEGSTRALFEAMGGKGKIVHLQGQIGHPVCTMRQNGFDRALQDYPDIQVLDAQPSDWDAVIGLQVLESWLTTYGSDLNGIMVMFDGSTPTLCEELKANGLNGKVLVGGNDGDENTIPYCVSGEVTADNTFVLANSAKTGVEFAIDLFNEWMPRDGAQNYRDIPGYIICETPLAEKVKATGWNEMEFKTPVEIQKILEEYAALLK